MAELTTKVPTEQSSSRRRFFRRYEHGVDEYGFCPAAYESVEKFANFLYKNWFKVEVAGLENIPKEGRAVLFGNHSGGLPVDGFLFYDGFVNQHSDPRRIRFLVTKFLLNIPKIGDALRGFGCVPPDYGIATKLLRDEELVFLYPEAEQGTGKLYKNRYHLEDFHAGFVRAAIETGSPLIQVVTIGGEEIYPILAHCDPLAKLLKWPYFPLTPFFPWLPFPLNFIPLPVKVMAAVWPPVTLKYPPEAARDKDLVAKIVEDFRSDTQEKVSDLRSLRTGPYAKWDMTEVNAYLQANKAPAAIIAKHC